jgi:hypothetical protein
MSASLAALVLMLALPAASLRATASMLSMLMSASAAAAVQMLVLLQLLLRTDYLDKTNRVFGRLAEDAVSS